MFHQIKQSFAFVTMSSCLLPTFFFFNDTATTEIYTLSLHDALPISEIARISCRRQAAGRNSDCFACSLGSCSATSENRRSVVGGHPASSQPDGEHGGTSRGAPDFCETA